MNSDDHFGCRLFGDGLYRLHTDYIHTNYIHTAYILIDYIHTDYIHLHKRLHTLHNRLPQTAPNCARLRGGGLGSRPKKMYGERLGDGVEYHFMKPTPRR